MTRHPFLWQRATHRAWLGNVQHSTQHDDHSDVDHAIEEAPPFQNLRSSFLQHNHHQRVENQEEHELLRLLQVIVLTLHVNPLACLWLVFPKLELCARELDAEPQHLRSLVLQLQGVG